MDLNYTRDTTSGQEGLDVLSQIRAIDTTLPVIVMTAWPNFDLAIETMHRGVSDFVQKPWENMRLLAALEKQIEQGRAARMARGLLARRGLELTEAAEVQRALLPRTFPQIPGWEISVSWRPAGYVSGDYVDILQFSDRHIGICIADVAGKGLPAALLMSNLQAALKAFAAADVSPGELCSRINSIMCRNTTERHFITLFYGLFDLQKHSLTYSNAGHNPPLIIGRDTTVLSLAEGGGVLGVFPDQVFQEHTMEMVPGDRLVLFTDGLVEARNEAGEEFGERRLRDLLIADRMLSAADLQARAMEAVSRFCAGRFDDDVTSVVFAHEQ